MPEVTGAASAYRGAHTHSPKPRNGARRPKIQAMDFLALRDYARNLLGKIATSGWRPLFGWGGGAMLLKALYFGYIQAPTLGLSLSDGYYNGLNVALAAFLGAFVARGVEKYMAQGPRAEPAPGGGLVNNEALA